MADLALVPTYPSAVEYEAPPTLIDYFDDGGSLRREKTSTVIRRFTHVYQGIPATEADTIMDLFYSKRLATSLTVVTYDPREAALTEATVYFVARPVSVQREAIDAFDVTVEFEVAL